LDGVRLRRYGLVGLVALAFVAALVVCSSACAGGGEHRGPAQVEVGFEDIVPAPMPQPVFNVSGLPVEPAPMPTTPPFDVNVTVEPAPMPTTPPWRGDG